MRIPVILILLLFLPAWILAQRQYSTTDKEALKHYVAANHDMDDNLYDDAINELKKAINEDGKFIEAHVQLGDLYLLKRMYEEAIPHFKAAIKINPDDNALIYFKLAQSELNDAKYTDALADFQKYLSLPGIQDTRRSLTEKLIADCNFSIHAIQHPVPFKPVNMGPEINTAADEYIPVTTADESLLIFTRKINNNEDFYKSVKADGKWQTAIPLSRQINTPDFNEGSQAMSQDGNYLFFTGCNRPDGLGRCDIYISQKKGDDWSKPFDLNPPVNTAGWESQPSISADGRTLYFVSNRKGGYGGYDIWKSKLTDKGWGEPENMGPNINTAYDEKSPFIHPDDSTFYFCSDGWPGLGNMDLFVSRLNKDGHWQKPENLGYPINTNGDENGLTVSANGSYAFLSSNNLKGYGGYDIYTFDLPQSAKPQLVTYVKGVINDAQSKQPLEAAVEIIDLETKQPVYQDYSSADEGNFLATLTSGKNYGLNISKSGYLFYSENFSLKGREAKTPFNLPVLLEPIAIGNKVVLKNIFFDTNRFDLKPESMIELTTLIDFLRLNPTIKIEISGHTDDVGNDQANQALSENRAKAVYQFLNDHGINASRLVFKGYGKTEPLVPNTSDENRAQNRRTEFKIIEK
jgi:outer membrane protein OmpA-like peptidoglycan-associated protein/tetratricopeptide (TPR) repeat protein